MPLRIVREIYAHGAATELRFCWLIVCFAVTCVSALAAAQEAVSGDVHIKLPSGTPIHLQLAATISTVNAVAGERVPFVVVENVVRDGVTVIPAGTAVTGTVAKVTKKHPLALPGKLVLSVDRLTLNGDQELRLQGDLHVKGRTRFFRMMAGAATTGLVFLPASPVFLLVRGDDAVALKSTEVTAYVQNEATVATSIRPSKPSTEFSQLLTFLPSRVSNGKGRVGDMVNLVLVAAPDDLRHAFAQAGWQQVDMSKPKIAWSLLQHGVKDTRLPMAHFFLYGRTQDYSYALPDPTHILSQRHHLRVWRTDCKVNGTPVWVAAATHDVAIEIKLWKPNMTHRIDPEVDAERDFVKKSLEDTRMVTRRDYVSPGEPVYEATTTGGQPYFSDGRLVMLELHTPEQPELWNVTTVTSPIERARQRTE